MTVVTDSIRLRWRGMRDMFLRYEAMLSELDGDESPLIDACRDLAAAFDAAQSNPTALDSPDLASKWDMLRAFMSTRGVLH